jgi:hypothetical protein
MGLGAVFGVDLATRAGTRARRIATGRESVMGIFSWFGSRKSAGNSKRGRHRSRNPGRSPDINPSLVRRNVESPALREREEAAAADVARVLGEDRPGGGYTGGNPSLVRRNVESPGLQEREEAAAEDVARVREDDKYFAPDAPDKRGNR